MENTVWTKVEPSWAEERVRQETSDLMKAYKLAIWNTLKYHPELLIQLQKEIFEDRLKDMRSKGIANTPLGLVLYLADLTVNLAGGSISICGNERKATISYDDVKGWDQFESLIKTEQQQNELVSFMNDTLKRFSNTMGFSCSTEVRFDTRPPVLRITFAVAPAKD
jgi:hypothetical protein